MTHISTSSLRDKLSEILNRTAFRGERIVLERHGKGVAAIVSMDDLELLTALEDRIDLELARKALKEKGSVPWRQVKKKLGLN